MYGNETALINYKQIQSYILLPSSFAHASVQFDSWLSASPCVLQTRLHNVIDRICKQHLQTLHFIVIIIKCFTKQHDNSITAKFIVIAINFYQVGKLSLSDKNTELIQSMQQYRHVCICLPLMCCVRYAGLRALTSCTRRFSTNWLCVSL